MHGLVFHLHGGAGQLDPSGIDQPLLFITDCIVRDMADGGRDGAVFGKREGLDLYFGDLVGVHKADVFVVQKGFDFKHMVLRHHHHQYLGFGDHTADGMHRQLLHGAIDRGGKRHVAFAGFALDQFLPVAGGFFARHR